MQLTHAIEQFSTYLRANHRSPLTIDVYRRDLLALVRYVGDLPLEELGPDRIHAFVASEAVQLKSDGSPRSPVTVNRCKATLRSFGSWLVQTGLADRNSAAGLAIRRIPRHSPKSLTDAERKRMVREVGARKGDAAARDRVMLDVLLKTGIRLSELVGLDLGDVDLDGKRIAIHAKGGRDETRFLNTDLRRILRRYLRQRQQAVTDTPALFLSSRGSRISPRQVQTRFGQWVQWAGIDRPGLSVHSTRHTFASRLYRQSKDLVLVAKAMGHRNIEASQVYVQTNDEELEEALESL